MLDVIRDAGVVTLGAFVQGGALVLGLIYGFGLQVRDWPWLIGGLAGVVFGRMAVQAVVGAVRG